MPTQLTLTPIDPVSIQLDWTYDNSNIGSLGTFIERSDDSGQTWATLAPTVPGTTYLDATVPAAVKVVYQIRKAECACPMAKGSSYALIDPLSLFGSDLHAWYRGDDVVLDVGGTVEQLVDKSGNSRHAINNDVAFQPNIDIGIDGNQYIDPAQNDALRCATFNMGLDEFFAISIYRTSGINNGAVHVFSLDDGVTDWVTGKFTNWAGGSQNNVDMSAVYNTIGMKNANVYSGSVVLAMMGTYKGVGNRMWKNGVEVAYTQNLDGVVTVPFDKISLLNPSVTPMPSYYPADTYEHIFIKGSPEDYPDLVNLLHEQYLAKKYPVLGIVSPNL